ncbi:MAG: diguanylate cyclase [Eubacterium sp.]|nr:diguanylate cyclase [Eubacterium sp.]
MSTILQNSKTSFERTQELYYLQRVIKVLMLILFTDAISWLCYEHSGFVLHIIHYTAIMIYFIAQLEVVVSWRRYVYYRTNHRKMSKSTDFLTCVLPMLVIALIVVTNPFTHLMFTISSDNVYARGPLNTPLALTILFYLVANSAFLLFRRHSEVDERKRREYKLLASFMIPPTVGSIIQAFYYGLSLIWPFSALGLLMLYINLSSMEISQDSLTRLNNRGTLYKFIHNRILKDDNAHGIFVIIDLDRFKAINDNYGHDVGDRALKQFSNLLKKCFDKPSIFLSRYGGDEFVVILPDATAQDAEKHLDKLQKLLDEYNASSSDSFSLNPSYGYTAYPTEDISIPEDLIRKADHEMYSMKKRHHATNA